MTVFHGEFKDKSDIIKQFELDGFNLEDYEIVFASYIDCCYSGNAYILLYKDRVFYEVNANHCSCYGLEGQFSLEETTAESVRFRINNGELGKHYCCDEKEQAFADILLAELAYYELEISILH